MRYWWVNQNKTYKSEIPGGFLWSPKARADGARNQFYENMREVQAGDVVFSFCDTRIKAVGIVMGQAASSPKPDFGTAGNDWSNEGWLVPVGFKEFAQPIRPKDHIALLREHLPAKYSPLQDSGDGLQSIYLTAVPGSLAAALIALIGDDYNQAVAELQGEVEGVDATADQQEEAIKGRTDIGATTKEQLVNARRGQGVFKANVRLNEKGCRITGVTDPQHLRASHIKPWRDCTDQEKLDGSNGLLLAPHIDHLFDRGLISFSDQGTMLLSPSLDPTVLKKWGVLLPVYVGSFNEKQCVYLKHHREKIFKGPHNHLPRIPPPPPTSR